MGLTIITGSSKTGKTHYITEKIAQSDCYSVMIVPEQISLITENRLIKRCGYLSSERDVLSFGRLFYRVYKEFSGKTREYISSGGKAIIVASLLNKSSSNLTVFSNSSRSDIYAGEILNTISEFKRYGISPEQTEQMKNNFSSAASKNKFSDLAFIYRNFNSEIEKQGENNEDNLSYLINLIPKSQYIKDRTFYIDGFSTFTKVELKIISLLLKHSKGVFITLKTDRRNKYIFSPVDETLRLLKTCTSKVEINEIHLENNYVHKDDLLHIWENYGCFPVKKYTKKTSNIFLYTSDTPENEVRLCARDILKYIRQGYKFSDICVVSGDLSVYASLVEKTFKEYGINIYIDKKHSVSETPLFLYFMSLFNIFINNFAYEDVFSFLKTGFTDIAEKDIAALENYVVQYGIKGKLWLEDFKFPDVNLATVNSSRKKLIDLVMPFREKTKGRTKISDYYEALKEFTIKSSLREKTEKISKDLLKRNEKAKSLEARQIFNAVLGVLKEMITVTDDYSIGLEKFSRLFSAGISQTKVGIVPPTQNSVTFSTYDSARNKEIKILYILNANEGIFPAKISSSGLITEKERSDMKKCDLEIAPDSRVKAFQQPFKIFETLTLPTDKLILSRSVSNTDGKNTIPSPVIKSLESILGKLQENVFKSKNQFDYISTPKATLKDILLNNDADFSEVKNWYRIKNNSDFEKITQQKGFTTLAKINSEVNELMWNKKLSVTVSRLETFAKCPYMFLLKYGLKLEKRKENIIQSADTGSFVHKILEDTLGKIIEERMPISELTPARCAEIADSVSDIAVDDLNRIHPNFSKKELYMQSKMKKVAKDASIAAINQIQAGEFVPYGTEMNIGSEDVIPPLSITTPNGNEVKLYGKIDRIDTLPDGFRIIDYKSSKHSLELNKAVDGISLQLVTYAKAITDKLGKPYGMYYFVFSPSATEKDSVPAADEILQDNIKSYKLSGITVGDVFSVLKADNNISGYSSVISARKTKDGTISSSNLISQKEFDVIAEKTIDKMGEYSDTILNGKFEIKPLCSEDRLSCDYCDYNSICKFEESYFDVREEETVSNKKFIETMRGENNEC